MLVGVLSSPSLLGGTVALHTPPPLTSCRNPVTVKELRTRFARLGMRPAAQGIEAGRLGSDCVTDRAATR